MSDRAFAVLMAIILILFFLFILWPEPSSPLGSLLHL